MSDPAPLPHPPTKSEIKSVLVVEIRAQMADPNITPSGMRASRSSWGSSPRTRRKKQGGTCALTGMPIDLGTFKDDYGMASLDRIDSTGGYTEGNVQWVHRTVNFMKQSLSDAELVQWCRRIVEFSDSKARDYE